VRRVRYSVASSLDGFIAGPNGEYDWIPMDPDIDFAAMFSGFDTMLMGRKSYEVAKTAGPDQMGMWKGMRVIVCSNSLNPDTHPDVEIVGKDLPTFIQKLKSEPGKDIWLFGGGDLFRSLLEAGLVDQVEVGLVPVLLGHGIPMLPKMDKKVRLELASHNIYPKTGTLMLSYNVLTP
jgi:Dihydrofolate reductase